MITYCTNETCRLRDTCPRAEKPANTSIHVSYAYFNCADDDDDDNLFDY